MRKLKLALALGGELAMVVAALAAGAAAALVAAAKTAAAVASAATAEADLEWRDRLRMAVRLTCTRRPPGS
ncbi:MAG: hypothetical protein ACLP01_19970 [Solirubrobacteraceae bacterium]